MRYRFESMGDAPLDTVIELGVIDNEHNVDLFPASRPYPRILGGVRWRWREEICMYCFLCHAEADDCHVEDLTVVLSAACCRDIIISRNAWQIYFLT